MAELASRSWNRAIAVADCDSFFVSCERTINPNLINKPVCVLSNNDGCVISRSREAKKLGVKMGEPAYMARKKLPEVIYLSSNYYLYGQTSKKVMLILQEFTPDVEIYSIDEAFLDLTGIRRMFKKSYRDIGYEIRNEIFKRTGIPVSIGISLSKALAKIAVEKAKDLDGVFTISGKELRETLTNTPVENVWQIGFNTKELLKKYGINNAISFTSQDESWIKKNLTIKGVELQKELSGESIWKVDPNPTQPKGIQRTKSFSSQTSNKNTIKGSLHYHLHRALCEARINNLKTGSLTIMLRRGDFKTSSLNIAISPPSNYEFDLIEKVNSLFEQIFENGYKYRSSGIYLSNLSSCNNEQLNLFSDLKTNTKKEALSKTWDKIESTYGKQFIKTASMPSLSYLDGRLIRGKEKLSSLKNLPEIG